MRGSPQKQNARRAYKIRLCGHLRRYKKIVKKTYIISLEIQISMEKNEPREKKCIDIRSDQKYNMIKI